MCSCPSSNSQSNTPTTLNESQRFVRDDGGYVIMSNGTQITIARARREQFFALFDKL